MWILGLKGLNLLFLGVLMAFAIVQLSFPTRSYARKKGT